MPATPMDLTGQSIGRLSVLRLSHRNASGARMWECRCSCGNVMTASTSNLRGNTKSCGCWKRERPNHKRTHGLSKTPEYVCWKQMILRCTNPENHAYVNYGARGIRVCDRWSADFLAFLSDMGKRPSSEHSLDRIDNDGDYEPGNCRWATGEQQHNNKRTCLSVTYCGHTMTIAQAARLAGVVSGQVAAKRVARGWSIDKAVESSLQPAGFPDWIRK